MSGNNLVGSIGKITSYGTAILRGHIRMVTPCDIPPYELGGRAYTGFTVVISMLNDAERACWFGDDPYNGEPEVEGRVRSFDVQTDAFGSRMYELIRAERPLK